MIDLFRKTPTIFGLELLSVAMALYHIRFKLAGRPAIVVAGNNAASGGIVKDKQRADPLMGSYRPCGW